MSSPKILAVLLSFTMLAACTEPNGAPGRGIMNGGALNKQDVGTGIGVVGGALVGSAFGGGAGRVVATMAGGLLGGVLGNTIGRSMDDTDRSTYERSSQRAMETGQAQSWNNPDSGHHGTIRPHKRYRSSNGQYCRKYTQTIYVDGKPHQGEGKACRMQDGSWKIAN